MDELVIHYWQLPDDLFVSLKGNYHIYFVNIVKEKINYNHKNCFTKVLNCHWKHSERLFNREIRFRIKELEILREFVSISKEEIEANLETLGNHEDGTIIKNPKLPFHMKDIIYVASHLMFDGSYRNKKGCYFYTGSEYLLEYHKNRLETFGDVPMKFFIKEDHLFFSYTIGYIVSKVLEIPDFRSLKVYLSQKFKILVMNNKILLDEFVKAMIIDEGAVDDKIRIELGNNKKLVDDIYEVVTIFYKLNKISTRTRYVPLENGKYDHYLKSWKIEFSASSFKLLYESISPLPISYKQENLELLYKIQKRTWYKRKPGETKKLIVKSLLEYSKSITELSLQLRVKQTTIRAHLRGHPSYSKPLISMGIVSKVNERVMEKGGFAKEDIFGIIDKNKANIYLENI